jgi:hypothetical protein
MLRDAFSPTKRRYWIVFFLFFVTYGYFCQGGGWNPNGRIYLTQAIVNDHSFILDRYREDAAEQKFVNMGDWAYHDGHYYSNKSPGLSFLAVPSFALTQSVLSRLGTMDAERQILVCAYVANLCTTVLLSSLLCLLIYYLCLEHFSLGEKRSFFAAVAFGLGTFSFPYSTAFYSHEPAAFFAFASLILAMEVKRGTTGKKRVLAVLAGLSAATGVLMEGSVLWLLGAVFGYFIYCRESRAYAPYFLIGCIPCALLQLGYNFACFGSPFTSSYDCSNPAVMVTVGGHLFGPPTRRSLYGLLFSPYRGLFYSSPLLLMVFPGLWYWLRERAWRGELLCCVAGGLSFFIFIASFYAWFGGWTPGPRYLLPAYPWFFLPCIFALRRLPRLFAGLAGLSVLINLAITSVGIEIPDGFANPLLDVVLKNLAAGRLAINPVPFSHYANYPSVFLLLNAENWPFLNNFNSFNLGELIFPYSLASLLPLFLVWGGLLALWAKSLPSE